MPSSLRDLRLAVRHLRRHPLISLLAIGCLALGIGGTTAVFTALDRALLRPLPFQAPEELVSVYRTTPHFDTGPQSAATFLDLADAEGLDDLAAIGFSTALAEGADTSFQGQVRRVSGSFFPLLGVSASRGRLLGVGDEAASADAVVVLSHEIWKQRWGGDPDVVGATLHLDGEPHRVVGIAPPAFRVPFGSWVMQGDLWVPLRFSEDELASRGSNWLRMVGRLAPGVGIEAAEAELRQIMSGLVEQFPVLHGEQVRVVGMQAEARESLKGPLLLVETAVALVLLVAMANVSALLLVQAVRRRQDMAVRSAVGASRLDLLRPVLSEGLVVSLLGGALGLAVAWGAVQTVGSMAAAQLPQLRGLALDLRAFAFAAAVCTVVSLLCSATPALRVAATDPRRALTTTRAGRDRGHHRILAGLVVAELALSVVLLVAAVVMLRGFEALLDTDPGFDAERLTSVRVSVSPRAYEERGTVAGFLLPALEEIRRLPGVEAAGAISLLPFQQWGWNFNIRYEGEPDDPTIQRPLVERRVVAPGTFEVTEQPLLAGRLFGPSDDASDDAHWVVVANEALVRRDFPGSTPAEVVGTRYHLSDEVFATIIGIVGDVKNVGPYREPAPEISFTYRQSDRMAGDFPILIRGSVGGPALAAAIHRIDAAAAVGEIRPMTAVIGDSVGRPRFFLVLLSGFAALALPLATAGLFGVLQVVVAERRFEMGIRSALGASPRQLRLAVARRGLLLTGLGLAVGLGLGIASSSVLVTLLPGLDPMDPTAWLVVNTTMLTAAAAAVAVPALRASRVDPARVMRAT